MKEEKVLQIFNEIINEKCYFHKEKESLFINFMIKEDIIIKKEEATLLIKEFLKDKEDIYLYVAYDDDLICIHKGLKEMLQKDKDFKATYKKQKEEGLYICYE